MNSEIMRLLNMQRSIFWTCSECETILRLADCSIFLRQRPAGDWMDRIEREEERLNRAQERLCRSEEVLREKARQRGRRQAVCALSKIDPIFTPRRLNPDDAKVLFHPIDFVVFHGMKESDAMGH